MFKFNIMMLRLLAVWSAAILLLSTNSFSQPMRPGLPLGFWIVGQTEDSVTVCISYSIPFSRLVFVKAPGSSSFYSSELDFSVDALDSTTGINSHEFHVRDIEAHTFSQTQDRELTASDAIMMSLPKANEKVTAEVRDDNQQITYVSRTFTRDIRKPGSVNMLSVIFIDSVSGKYVFPCVESDMARFPGTIRALVVMKRPQHAPPSFIVKSLHGTVVALSNQVVSAGGRLSVEPETRTLCITSPADSGQPVYLVSFPSDTISPGPYEFMDAADSLDRTRFALAWLDEPISLRDEKMAVSLLKYILPDSIYSELSSGSDDEIRMKFEAYWKSHDPTPGTAYNELEDEFYSRADYAFEKFSTLSTRDGTDTDMGRAFIVYGKPAEIRRELKSDGSYETWLYPAMKRALVFKEEKYGDFKLYRTEKL